ncbi:MAG TPA: rRNA maturation RNase YbeY [Terriglobales bacterium]|nr:rRNA maturation RNase YbeY [Terriglobales bacterium]
MVIIKKKMAGLSQASLRRFAVRAIEAAGITGKVNVLVTDSRELQELNRRFRHKNASTDVLSFPAGQQVAHELAGDIAISAEIAAANARKLGHSPVQEIKILILHGVLHLAGYDHERDNGLMARREAHLRRAFKLPAALLERYAPARQVRVQRPNKSRGI